MPTFLARIKNYIQALGKTGQLLTVLGVLPTAVDIAAPLLGLPLSIPPLAAVLWFLIAFGLANLRVFEQQVRSDIEIQIFDTAVHLERWLHSTRTGAEVATSFPLIITGKMRVYNQSQVACHVRLYVADLAADWGLTSDLSSAKVGVDRFISRANAQSGNPFSLAPGEIDDPAQFRAEIPLSAPTGIEPIRELGRLTSGSALIRAEAGGRPSLDLHIQFDTQSLRTSIINEILTRFQHANPDTDWPRQLMMTLAHFWGIDNPLS